MTDVTQALLERPRWRGHIHQWSTVALAPVFVMLVWSAPTWAATVAVAVYAVAISSTFAVSAAYHRLPHATACARAAFRRADHATIFVGIAGTYTPVCLLGLPPVWGLPLLVVAWSVAAVGVTLAVRTSKLATRVEAVLYGVAGWACVVAVPVLVVTVGWAPVALIAAGGVLYSVGALLFARGRPRLRPATFGYHEVWHAFTVAAAVCHLAAIWMLVQVPPVT